MFIDGCQAARGALPPTDGPLTVGIDGGYVRGREGKARTEGHFELIEKPGGVRAVGVQ